jgi:hypothetical protein
MSPTPNDEANDQAIVQIAGARAGGDQEVDV